MALNLSILISVEHLFEKGAEIQGFEKMLLHRIRMKVAVRSGLLPASSNVIESCMRILEILSSLQEFSNIFYSS